METFLLGIVAVLVWELSGWIVASVKKKTPSEKRLEASEKLEELLNFDEDILKRGLVGELRDIQVNGKSLFNESAPVSAPAKVAQGRPQIVLGSGPIDRMIFDLCRRHSLGVCSCQEGTKCLASTALTSELAPPKHSTQKATPQEDQEKQTSSLKKEIPLGRRTLRVGEVVRVHERQTGSATLEGSSGKGTLVCPWCHSLRCSPEGCVQWFRPG